MKWEAVCRNDTTIHFGADTCTRTTLRRRLDQDGIAVVSDVLTPSHCRRTKSGIAQWLGSRGVDVRNPQTWYRYSNDYLEMSPSILGMMNTGTICNEPFVVDTRRHANVRRLFELIHGTPHLQMEHAGVFWGFPPEHYPGSKIPGERCGGFMNRRDMWMHTDRGRVPSSSSSPSRLMTLIMLEDADLHDYTFVYLTQSHLYHDEFLQQHPLLEMEEPGNNFIQLTFEDVQWFERKGCQWRKVVAPKGTVVVWSDRLIHSTCLPARGRPSPKPRFVVYGGFQPQPV